MMGGGSVVQCPLAIVSPSRRQAELSRLTLPTEALVKVVDALVTRLPAIDTRALFRIRRSSQLE